MKNVQIPDELYEKAEEFAEADHVSVDRVVAAALSEKVGDWSRLRTRAERGSVDKLRSVLAKVGDAPPEADDQL